MDKCIQIRIFLPMYLPELMRLKLNQKHTDGKHRQHEKRCKRQLPVFNEHDDSYTDHRQKVRKQLCHTVGVDFL